MAGQSSVIFLSILDTQSHQVTSALGWRGRPDKGTFILRTGGLILKNTLQESQCWTNLSSSSSSRYLHLSTLHCFLHSFDGEDFYSQERIYI